MKRRTFIHSTTAALAALFVPPTVRGAVANEPEDFVRIASFIRDAKIDALPIGEAIVAIGKHFLGTPYVANTLEVNATEQCVINFRGLDCVTFFELSLDLARIAKKRTLTYDALVREVTFTRYRAGKIMDYASRLHYTTDWFADNARKDVVRNITADLGGVPYDKKIDFMSTHPAAYRQLRENHRLVAEIRAAEARLARERMLYVPKERVAAIEAKLADGDIIGITTTIPGIDCSHTGLIVRDGTHARFLHASSVKHQVIIADGSLGEYLMSVSKHTGIIAVRPLEPGT